MTNTNWQFYGGETTLSAVSQMAGLTVQNFVSAAAGIAVLVAVVRASPGGAVLSLGNSGGPRSADAALRPGAARGRRHRAGARLPGRVQTLRPRRPTTRPAASRLRGPVASQDVIKELGTNGGGYFNVNSAMPFENPNGLTNFLEMPSYS